MSCPAASVVSLSESAIENFVPTRRANLRHPICLPKLRNPAACTPLHGPCPLPRDCEQCPAFDDRYATTAATSLTTAGRPRASLDRQEPAIVKVDTSRAPPKPYCTPVLVHTHISGRQRAARHALRTQHDCATRDQSHLLWSPRRNTMASKAQASSEGDSSIPPQSAGKLSPAADACLGNQGLHISWYGLWMQLMSLVHLRSFMRSHQQSSQRYETVPLQNTFV